MSFGEDNTTAMAVISRERFFVYLIDIDSIRDNRSRRIAQFCSVFNVSSLDILVILIVERDDGNWLRGHFLYIYVVD